MAIQDIILCNMNLLKGINGRAVGGQWKSYGSLRSFSSSGHVWRWGMTGSGVSILSKGSGEKSTTPEKIEGFNNVSNISCNSDHSAFINNGKVYTYGSNKSFQLGYKVENEKEHCPFTPKEVQIIDEDTQEPIQEKFVQVVCGGNHTVAVTESNSLYVWGWGGSFWNGIGGLGTGKRQNEIFPCEVDIGDVIPRQVSCGQHHTVVLDEQNQIYTAGKGDFGRLGRGHQGDQWSFEKVEALDLVHPKVEVKKITTGLSHNAILTEDGRIFVWGRNDKGQLGIDDSMGDMYSGESYPREIKYFSRQGIRIVDISAGDNCMIAVAESGAVYYWGNAMWLEPRLVSLPSNMQNSFIKDPIKEICAGSQSAAVLTETGLLYTWGKGKSGCLVRATSDGNEMEPHVVPPEMFNNEKILSIKSSGHRMIAITSVDEKVTL